MKIAIHDKKEILPLLALIFFLGAVLFAPVPLHADDEVGEIEQVFYGTSRNDPPSPISQVAREMILRAALWEPAELTVEMEPTYQQYINEATSLTRYSIEGYQIMEFNVSDPPSLPTAARPDEVPFLVSPPSHPAPLTGDGDRIGGTPLLENGGEGGGCSIAIPTIHGVALLSIILTAVPALIFGVMKKTLISQEEVDSWFERCMD